MGEMADDLINGACCSHCGIYFEAEHGYPVLCTSCFFESSKEERAGIQRATEDEM